LGGRKGIWPVKKLSEGGADTGICLGQGADLYGPADATATHSHASVKSKLVLPFWYRLAWVVLDKWLLNRWCCCLLGLLG